MKSLKSPSRKKPPPFPGEPALADHGSQAVWVSITPACTIRSRGPSVISQTTSSKEGTHSSSGHSSSIRSSNHSPTRIRLPYLRPSILPPGRTMLQNQSQSELPDITSSSFPAPRRRSTSSSATGSLSSSGHDSEESVYTTATESSCASAITASTSITPLQLIQSYGYVGARMISDEPDPFDLRGSLGQEEGAGAMEASGCRDENVFLRLAGRWDDTGIGTMSEPLLADEMPPFDLATLDSIYPLHCGGGETDIVTLGFMDAPTRRRNEVAMITPSRHLVKKRASWSPGASESPGSRIQGELESLDWPLPPRKSIIVRKDDVEIWTEPIVEYLKALSPPLEPHRRHSLRIPKSTDVTPGHSRDSSTSSLRIQTLTPPQVTNVMKYFSSLNAPTPPLVVISPARPQTPPPTNRMCRKRPPCGEDEYNSTPRAPRAYLCSSQVLMTMTEARIDTAAAGSDNLLPQKEFCLGGEHVPGVLNKITLVSPSWKTLGEFCERNGASRIYSTSDNDYDDGVVVKARSELIVTVEDVELEDGTVQVSASMYVSGAELPLMPAPGPFMKVAAKFSLSLPTSFAEIGRSMSDNKEERS
ncbi:hypothetical protein FRB97_008875 [Tulasnella sp. 331]|nr:hypothetical protein FRB97_008875 [Tulasnella sp. 331]